MSDSPATPLRLQGQIFKLGDRVINVMPHGNAPIDIKGTVNGINLEYLEILFKAISAFFK